MTANNKIQDFLKYLILHGVSQKSLKYYKSDLSIFLAWAKDKKISQELIHEYIESIRLITSTSTLNRRISTLRSFSTFMGFKKSINTWQDKILSKFESKPKVKNTLYKIFFNRPNWYKKYHSYPLATYIHIAILILFTSVSGYAFYDQVFYSADRSLAFPTALTRPNRFLSFQGRLTNNVGNPITSATNVVFKLYDADSGGTTLWNSGTCSITPDQDGIFSTLLGSSCGTEIASSVFSENSSVWVGVTVAADAEATPRIQIATVAYALNAETLQGFPAGTGTSTIPYINSAGTLVLANASPKIQSTSGTFAVEGLAMTISTPNASDGVVTINPDGIGTLDLTFEGTAPGLSANGFVNATNANITSGSLYSGTVASAASGYNFINFLSGVSPTSKFSVDSTGLTTVGADLYVSSGISLYNNTVTDDTVEAGKFCTGDGETNCVTDFSTFATGTNYWTRSAGNISPLTLNDTFSATTSAAVALTLTQTGDYNAILIEDQASDPTPFVVDQSGNVGIGATAPISKLSVGNNGALGYTAYIMNGDDYGVRAAGNNYGIWGSGGSAGVYGSATNSSHGIFGYATGTGNGVLGSSSNAGGFGVYGQNSSSGIGGYFTSTSGYALITNTGNVGIGDTSPAALFTVGSGDLFQVDSSGNTSIDNQGDIRLLEGDAGGSNYVGFQAPATLAGDNVYTVPSAFPAGATGYYLTSNTTGDMSWSNSITASSLKWNALIDPDGALTLAHGTYATTFGWTPTGALDAMTFNVNNNGGSSTNQNGLVINNAVVGSFTDTATETLLKLQQLDTTAAGTTTVTDALLIDSAGNSGIVDAIHISNTVGNITNGIDISDTTGTIDKGIVLSGTFTTAGIDAGNSIITNIGNAGTDFNSSGGLTLAQNLSLTASSNLVFSDTNTTLAEATSAVDSGAYKIGVFDEFDNSASSTVQAVLNDLDTAITTGGGSTIWSLATGVISPTTATNDFAIGGTTLAASIFSIDESAGTFLFGGDQSANPTLRFEATDSDTADFGFNTSDAFYFSGANVGIGTTTPASSLQVTGGGTYLRTLTAPTIGAVTCDIVGGTLAAGTYYYKVATLDGNGLESIASSEASGTVASGSTGSCSVAWTDVTGFTSYRVYGRSTAAQDQYWADTATPYVDTGTTGTIAYPSTTGVSALTLGRVGIGSRFSASPLHVSTITSTSYQTALTLDNPTNAGGSGTAVGLRFRTLAQPSDAYAKAGIAFENKAIGFGLGSLHFMVDSNGDSSNADIADAKMTINYLGNVGIGTTSPSALLDVAGTASASGALTVGNGTTNTIRSPYGDLSLQYKSAANAWTTSINMADISGDIDFAGGLSSAGCTITNSTGDLACSGTITGTITASVLPWSGLTAPASALTLAHGTYATTFGWTPTGALDAMTFNVNNNGGSSTNQNGLVINNAVVGSFTDTATETLLKLQQLDTTAAGTTAVTDALLIDSAANSGIVDAIHITNSAGNITTGLDITDTAGGTITTGIALSGTFTTGIDAGNSIITNIGNAGTDFDSSGGLTLAGNLVVRGTTGLTFNTGAGGDITFALGEKIDNDTDGKIAITATTTDLSGNLEVTGGNILNSAGTANIVFSATPTTSGNTLSASNWIVDNTANVGHAALIVNNTKAGDLFTASASGTPKFVITNAGNVGIGTTLPTYALDISSDSDFRLVGAGRTDGITLQHVSTGNYLNSSIGTGTYSINSAGGALTLASGTSTDNLYLYTGDTSAARMTVIGGAGTDLGFVGIGVTAPASNLHLQGFTAPNSTTYSSHSFLTKTEYKEGGSNLWRGLVTTSFKSSASADWSYSGVRLASSIASGSYAIDNQYNNLSWIDFGLGSTGYAGDIRFGTGNSATNERMRIDYAGNVGIGNQNPTELLDVAGDIRSTTGSLQIGNTANLAYSRFGTTTTTHSGNLTSSADVLLQDLEIDGTLFLDGGIITNIAGTTAISLSATPTTTSNTLSSGNWMVDNTANVGLAALIANNTKAGDLFTASASGTTKFTVQNDGDVVFSNKLLDSYVTAGISLGDSTSTALSGFGSTSIVGALNELKTTNKNISHNDYLSWANHYTAKAEGSNVETNNTLNGLFFDTFADSTKIDGTNSTSSGVIKVNNDHNRVGLTGGQTYNTATNDNDGQAYLESNIVNNIFYYDRTTDSSPEVQVELGIDPNWYNGVTLSVATSSATYSQNATINNKNPNLTTKYNGSLIKVTGTDTTPRAIYITIKSPTTFDWTNYQGDAATGVTITPGTAQALGVTGVSVTFTATNYNVGDVFKIASWFIEAEGTTRGAKQQFPERANIITTGSGVNIIDADTQKMWMAGMGGYLSGFTPLKSTMLNGILHVATTLGGVRKISFANDRAGRYYTTGYGQWSDGISLRNTSLTFTSINSALSVVDVQVNDIAVAVIPNQTTQEVTVSGWGYIVGDNTALIEETVNLPYKFNNTPIITTTLSGRTGPTAPANLRDCTTLIASAAGALPTSITNSNFAIQLAYEVGATWSSTNYICYTWTATGIVSPKQFMVAATGTSTSGGTDIFNETDGTVAHILSAAGVATSQVWQSKVAIAGNNLYTDNSNGTVNTSAINLYYGIHGLSTEATNREKSRGFYQVGVTPGSSFTNIILLGTATGTNQVKSLVAKSGTSTIEGKSDTLYIGSTSGVSVIQSNQGFGNLTDGLEENSSSVKYYTKDYISEEMIGDIRGMWPINNGNASSDFEDVSIKANTLTGTNITAGGDSVSGVRGTATDFDGSTEYMSCADASCGGTTKLDPGSGSWSFGAWIKTSTSGVVQNIVRKGSSALVHHYYLRLESSNVVGASFGDGSSNVTVTSPNTVTDGLWHHLVYSINRGTDASLYIDGIRVAHTTYTSVTSLDSTTDFNIGTNVGANQFNGQIDEAFVTATAVTPGQVKNMYQVGYRALQSHGTGLGGGATDTNQQLGYISTGTSSVGIVAPDYNNQYMYVGTNSTTLGAVSKIQLNSDTNIKKYTSSANVPSGGTLLIDEDVSSLGVGYNLEAVGSAASGVKSMAPDNNANALTGSLFSKTKTLSSATKFAYLWTSFVTDASDATSAINIYACNAYATKTLCDTNNAWVLGTIVQTDSSQSTPEREYNFSFTSAGSYMTFKINFSRGSTKTNTFIERYGATWSSSVGGADLAERYKSSEAVFPGDIVSLTEAPINGEALVSLSRMENDKKVIGIVTTNPGIVMDDTLVDLNFNASTRNSPDRPAVALSGRVPLKVSTKNGEILVGDAITTSDIPGVGVKATKAGNVVAKAIEPFSCEEGVETCEGKIMAFVNVSWFDPDVYLTEAGDIKIKGYETLSADGTKTNIVYKIVRIAINGVEEVIDRIGVFGTVTTGRMEAGIISPVANSDLIIDLDPTNASSSSKLVIKGVDNKEVVSIDANGQITSEELIVNNDATVSGILYADKIESQRLDEIESLLAEVEGNQVLFAEATNWEPNTATESANISDIIASNLFVTGNASITSLFVAENLTAKSLDSIDGILSIQSLAIAPVEIMAGKIKIDTNGNAEFLGDIKVAGNFELAGNFVVAGDNSQTATDAGEIIEGQTNSNATAGKATLIGNSLDIKIINPKVKTSSLIYVTPVSSTQNKVLYVKSKGTGEFIVGFNEPIDTAVEFNWWIIELH